jgi:hypothetical protein
MKHSNFIQTSFEMFFSWRLNAFHEKLMKIFLKRIFDLNLECLHYMKWNRKQLSELKISLNFHDINIIFNSWKEKISCLNSSLLIITIFLSLKIWIINHNIQLSLNAVIQVLNNSFWMMSIIINFSYKDDQNRFLKVNEKRAILHFFFEQSSCILFFKITQRWKKFHSFIKSEMKMKILKFHHKNPCF